ncbi:MAG: histidine kinase [Rhizobiaceae bacterium]|nr:histidine kinase [Rhizobiaceae bacterium]
MVALSSVWALLSLIVITTVIAALYRQASERGFESLLSAHLFNLIGSVGVSPTGQLTGNPDLGDLRFSIPASGWYYSVVPVSTELKGEVRSTSMIGTIEAPPLSDVPFNTAFQRSYVSVDPKGQNLQVLESEFVLDQHNRVARFRVMGNRSELDAEINSFERRLLGYLALFGVGMIAINAVAILFGLWPLGRVRAALAQVREGTAKRLDGSFPTEIEPLANETNALIENNRRIVERSRRQVGNLAHSLKTPLAVMLNEGRALGGARGRLIEEQASAMQQQLDHYLQRARMAAQRDSVVFRTPVAPLLQRMVRVMAKISPDKSISLEMDRDDLIFAGEQQDLEEIAGNLIENAMKWSRAKVVVSLRQSETPAGGTPKLELAISDDGPGIPEDKKREALQRGKRLDETKPGSGLGLAIVADLVKEYDGAIKLERSHMGGLKAIVQLKCAE